MSEKTRVTFVLGSGKEEYVDIHGSRISEMVTLYGLKAVRVERVVEREEIAHCATFEAAK